VFSSQNRIRSWSRGCYPCGLFFLAALPVVAADVCLGLPDVGTTLKGPHLAPGWSSPIRLQGAKSKAFRVSVKTGGPAFRITVSWRALPGSDNLVHAGDLEVARCRDGERLQVIPIMSRQLIDFPRTLHASDINFDGYLDLAVVVEFSSKSGSEMWLLFDPAAGRFVQNELTQELDDLKTNGYDLAPNKHEIIAHGLMVGCPPLNTIYRVEGERLITVHREDAIQRIESGSVSDSLPPGVPCTVTFLDLIGQQMQVTRVRRYVDGRPVK
jgi:hypothetical protein